MTTAIALQDAEIFDVDGTLVDVSGIRHLIKGPGGFTAFHRASASCPPNQYVVEAAREAHARGRAVLIMTGRDRRWERLTSMWLALHDVPSTGLWMRGRGDYRPDYVIKRELLRSVRRQYNVLRAWDDNPNVIRLWSEENIPVEVVPGWVDEQ
ncbi:hypothetical protein [Streptomyces sp. MBT33]|uniref:phosphatase domain-containing protein n=1 Tax=Streptomyces sp. MBT33 TaxID=1488363 RepID=UPI0027DC25F8|nr:hypothetical protein [Streptomyces sp. MBT33]